SITDVPNNRLLHDKSWKESNEKLAKEDIWKNPAFGPKLIKSQSEETYMTDVIVPMI
ncbi:4216_t:CDS:2, partial [Funneliformis geosporum]